MCIPYVGRRMYTESSTALSALPWTTVNDVYYPQRLQVHHYDTLLHSYPLAPPPSCPSAGLMKLRRLLLGRKVMTNLDSTFKSTDITLPTKVRLVKAMVFPPLASRVAQGVSGPSSSCVWNPRVFLDDARECQCPFVLCPDYL